MLWQKLAKTALLGTDHSQLEENALQRISELGIDTHQEAPLMLADGISMLVQLRKAGFQLADFQGQIPTQSDQEEVHSHKAQHLLHLILSGPHVEVFAEYLTLLRKANKSIPASEIPAMMGLKELQTAWQVVEPLIGEEGRWLLRQHPEWSKLLEDPTRYNWLTGSRQERLKMLAFWRSQSPSFALELIQSTWETEGPNDKATFLATLKTNLSEAEEPFLEACLVDKRKEVRMVAAALLAKIPGSALSVRMRGRAVQFLSIKSNKLEVNLPEEPDDLTQKDGIQKLHPDWQGGAKAALLGQLVSKINPRFWETHFNLELKKVIDLFDKSDWAVTLRQALVTATVFHEEEDWAVLLTEKLLKEPNLTYTSILRLDALLELLPTKAAHHLAMRNLTDSSELPSQFSIGYYLLNSHEGIWPDEVSLLIINKFRKEIYKDYRQFWQMHHLLEWLKLLGLRCNPSLYEQLQTGWTNTDFQWRYWEKPVEEMLAKVLFRLELRKEFGLL